MKKLNLIFLLSIALVMLSSLLGVIDTIVLAARGYDLFISGHYHVSETIVMAVVFMVRVVLCCYCAWVLIFHKKIFKEIRGGMIDAVFLDVVHTYNEAARNLPSKKE